MSAFDKIAEIIERVTGKKASEVTPAMTLFDASPESLDHIEVVLEIENDYDVDFRQGDLDLVGTVGQLAELTEGMLAERNARAA